MVQHKIIKRLETIVAFLMLLVATTAQAKRVVERPYFLGSNNHKLEIERVTLDKKATFLDVKIYQASGEVGIDSHASIMANGVKYDYIAVSYTHLTQPTIPAGIFMECVSMASVHRPTFRNTCCNKHLIRTASYQQPTLILARLL